MEKWKNKHNMCANMLKRNWLTVLIVIYASNLIDIWSTYTWRRWYDNCEVVLQVGWQWCLWCCEDNFWWRRCFSIERTDIAVLMEPTQATWTVADIDGAVQKHNLIVPSLLAVHTVTGFDNVCYFHNVGKK